MTTPKDADSSPAARGAGLDALDSSDLQLQLDGELEPGFAVGEYEVVAKVGEGGFGVVYRAIHPLIAKPAAIKVLRRHLSSEPETVARFIAEARAVNTIRHRNIIDIFSFGTLDDGRLFLVMELLDGHGLDDHLRRHERLDPEQLCEIMGGVAKALDAAHHNGIVHRDLKPENVFLHFDEEGQLTPKLLDFGIAKLLDDDGVRERLTRTGTPIGTPQYMAPEQCLGQAVDHRADIYAYGLVCFEALTGEPAFSGTSLVELMNKHIQAARPQVSRLVPTLGEGFDDVLRAMMEIEREQRPPTVGEAFVLLHRACFGVDPDLPSQPPVDWLEPGEVASRGTPSASVGLADGTSRSSGADGLPAGSPAAEEARRFANEPTQRALPLAAARPDDEDSEDDAEPPVAAVPPPPSIVGRLRRRSRLMVAGVTAAAVAVVVAQALYRRDDSAPPAGTASASPSVAGPRIEKVRRLTFEPGCEEYPSFLPDGDSLVFDGVIDGDYELLQLDLESGKRTRLTHTPGWDYAGAVSPDGAYLAHIHFEPAARQLRLLSLSGADQGEARVLGQTVSFPLWSPGGTLLVGKKTGQLVEYRPDGSKSVVSEVDRKLWVRQALRNDRGEVYVTYNPTNRLGEISLGRIAPGGRIEPLDQEVWEGLALSPQGSSLYYSRKSLAGRADLVWRPLRGGAPTVLPGALDPRAGITVSRDGRRLALSSCTSRSTLSRLGDDSSFEPVLSQSHWRDQGAIAVDDRRVLFSSDRSGQTQIWQADLESGKASSLTGPNTSDGSPSPDGSQLVFSDRRRGGLFMRALGGGEARRLTDQPSDKGARFCRDGQRVLFTRIEGDTGQRIYVVPLDGGEPTAVSEPGCHSVSPSRAADRMVYLRQEREAVRLWTAQDDGSGPRPFPALPAGVYHSPSFSPDGSQLLLIRGRTEVIKVAADGRGEPKVVWKAGLEALDSVGYTADGQGILATVSTYEGDLWLAEGFFP